MRTRRSHRNQEIMWNYLAGPKPVMAKKEGRIYTDDEIDAMWLLSKSERAAMKREMAGKRMRKARNGGTP